MKQKILTVTLNPSIDKTITLEKLLPYQLNRAISTRQDPGGKGINVARVLKNLNMEVLATGLIAGELGKNLLNTLNNTGISNDFYCITGETRTNLKIQDSSNNNKITEINEPGFFVSQIDLDGFRKKYRDLVQQSQIVVLSGSIPPGVPTNFYEECIEVAHHYGKHAILDADGQAFIEGLKAIPFAIKPNLQELEVVAGHKLNSTDQIVQQVKEFLAQGIQIVIVSMGADGAIIGYKNDILKVDAWDIDVKVATGSGDSMVAALIYSIQKGQSLQEIAKMSVAAGTVTASKVGTQICTLDEVLQSKDKVTIHTLSH